MAACTLATLNVAGAGESLTGPAGKTPYGSGRGRYRNRTGLDLFGAVCHPAQCAGVDRDNYRAGLRVHREVDGWHHAPDHAPGRETSEHCAICVILGMLWPFGGRCERVKASGAFRLAGCLAGTPGGVSMPVGGIALGTLLACQVAGGHGVTSFVFILATYHH